MIEQEKVIEMFFTKDKISNERCDSNYIVNGIDNLMDIVDRLRYNGRESIFVHLESPISSEQLNNKLLLLCKQMKEKGLVNAAKLSRLGLPMDSSRYNTSFDKNNLLKSERYMIIFIK